MTDVRITRGARRAVISLLALVLIIGAGNLVATFMSVQASQHKWCSTLVTLDEADQRALHAPPSQRPKGAYSLALIKDFHDLRSQFGCG